MFDFRIRVFHTVAKRLSFTKAAEELYITQPAVTKHIRELEAHFKQKLFERNGNKIQLTIAGKVLLRHSETLFLLYREIAIDMNELVKEQKGRLRIGASTTVSQYVLPPRLSSFRHKFRDIDLTLSSGNTEQIENALLNNEIDIGIIEGHSKNRSIQYTHFLKDEIVLVCNINHPMASRKSLAPEELKSIPLLIREPGSGTLAVIAHALRTVGIKLSQIKTEMQLDSSESIKTYLLNSPCMAFLSIHAVRKELQHHECRIMDIEGLTIERSFYMIQPHGQTTSLTELFIKFLKQYHLK